MGSSTDVERTADLEDGPWLAKRLVSKREKLAGIRGTVMILATTTVENVDRFLEVFAGKGADKRALHGSKGSTVFRDPREENRVWVLFDWDEQGWTSFVTDPEVPPILKDAGHLSKPEPAPRIGAFEA
jgi:hypothetical protein